MADKLSEELGVPEDTGLQYANGLAYWGAQDGTSGTVYLGRSSASFSYWGRSM